MARSSVDNTIERIRRQLASTVRMEISVLGASLNATETTVTLAYDPPNSLRTGSVLSVGTELMRVITVDTTAKEAVVLRGWQDTNGEAHVSGDEVLINPRFTRFDIFDAIIQEIDSWEPDLFTVTDVTADVSDSSQGFEIEAAYANALGVMSVRRNYTTDDSVVWPEMSYVLHRGRSANLTPTEGSGLFVRFTDGIGYVRSAGTVVARLALPFDTSSINIDSDLSDAGVNAGLLELVELGVKSRLLADDENGRSARTSQDEPRRVEEVPVNQVMSLAQVVLQRYERRRNLEIIRLRTRNPFKAW